MLPSDLYYYIAAVGVFVTSALSLAAFITGRYNAGKINEIHISINGRLDQYLKLIAEAEHAKGVVAGIAQGAQTNPDNQHTVIVRTVSKLEVVPDTVASAPPPIEFEPPTRTA